MKTITFYSYKGGVGRTLALANVAMRLSEFNKKVCIMDFDLEAPGLHHKFKQQLKTFEFKNGIVDYIHEFVANDVIPESIQDYVKVIDFNAKNKVPIDFIPAGNSQHNDYWKKLARISWKELFYEEDSEGLPFFLDLKGKIEAQLQPDFLLIDARTGLSEIAGITVSILADHVVVIAANNEENLQGAKMMLDAFSHPENVFFDKAPETTFVLSRIPYPHKPNERQRERIRLEEVRKRMEFEENKEILVIHSDRELEVKESLLIAKDSDESVPIAQDYLKLFEEITKNDLTEKERESYKNIKEAEKYFNQANRVEDYGKKLELLNKAISLVNDSPLYYLNRSKIHLHLKSFNKAIEDTNRVIALGSNSDYIHVLRGYIYTLLKNKEKALSEHLTALNLNNQNDDTYARIASIYGSLNNLPKSLEYLNKAIELNSSSAEYYNSRGNIFRKTKQYKNSFKDIYKSLSLNPELGIAYGTLAELYAQKGNSNEFYKNIELALYFNAPFDEFSSDEAYQPFLKEKRFLDLLDKYNIEIPQTK